MEEVLPIPAVVGRPRGIKLRLNGSSSTAKRKAPNPELEEVEVSPAPKAKRRGRAASKKEPAPAATSTRSLRSRAPMTEEKVQADRVARARIRAALSEDVAMSDEEDV